MHDSQSILLTELLQRARAGDGPAREQLFARCRNYVAIVARTQMETALQSKIDASDLVQQTLLEAHRGFAAFRGTSEAEWLAWLRVILSHNAADFTRRYRQTAARAERRERPWQQAFDGSDAAVPFEPSDPGESPSAQVARREREIEVADAIAGLEHDHREVIVLRNLQRLPFDEVARRLGRSRPAAQMLWMRAIQKLREVLHE